MAPAVAGGWSPWGRICRMRPGAAHFLPLAAAAKKLDRFLSVTIFLGATTPPDLPVGLGGQLLATLGAAAGNDFTAVFGRHAGSVTVAALAHQFAGLICTFHETNSKFYKSRVYRWLDPQSQLARSPSGDLNGCFCFRTTS